VAGAGTVAGAGATTALATTTTTPPPPPTTSGPNGVGIVSGIAGGLAVVASGVAIGTGVAALGQKSTLDDNCNEGLCPARIDGDSTEDIIASADSLSLVSTVFGFVGLALGATAIILAIVAAGSDDPAPVALSPFIHPEGGGVAAGGVF